MKKLLGLMNIYPLCDPILVHICHPKAISENLIKLMCNSAPSVTELQSISPCARLKFNHKLNYIAGTTLICFPTRRCNFLSTSVLFTLPSRYFPPSPPNAS